MKKTILLASLILSFGLAKAQDAKSTASTPANTVQKSTGKKENHRATPDQKADKFVMKMTEAVGLEEAQKIKVKSLATDHFTTMETARKQANGDKEKIKTEGKKSRQIFNQGLKKVLTSAQFESWKVKRKEAAKKQKSDATNEPSETIED